MGCGASFSGFLEVKSKNELLNMVMSEKSVYTKRLQSQKKSDKDVAKAVVEGGKIKVEENPLEVFVEGINIIERNLKSNNEYSDLNQLKSLVNEYFKLGNDRTTNSMFAIQKKLEVYFYKNLITKPKLVINQVPENQFPKTNNNIPPNQFPESRPPQV
jgi:hypothetical protein